MAHVERIDAYPVKALDRCSLDDARILEGGTIAFDRLFAAINEALQDASETTETLTDRTMTLAEHLTA